MRGNNSIITIPIKLKSQSSEIIIGYDILSQLTNFLSKKITSRTIVIVSNHSIWNLWGAKLESIFSDFSVKTILIEEGESFKTLSTIEYILDQLIAYHIERNDAILALGGGVIGDMAGFAASIYLRGIKIIQLPTTLLAQVDSAIGGKTGVNHHNGKNLIGTFYHPILTFVDLKFLETLPQREIQCGLGEIIKYGVIRNPRLFKFIEANMKEISSFNIKKYPNIWLYLISESCKDKAYVVSKDEKEANLRMILNYGHTIGHAIETAGKYQLYHHGEAVALGMIVINSIAQQKGILSQKTQKRIEDMIRLLGLPLSIQHLNISDILVHLTSDKKIKEGILRFICPEKIGKVRLVNDITFSEIKTNVTNYLR